jgi:hypothetical protein
LQGGAGDWRIGRCRCCGYGAVKLHEPEGFGALLICERLCWHMISPAFSLLRLRLPQFSHCFQKARPSLCLIRNTHFVGIEHASAMLIWLEHDSPPGSSEVQFPKRAAV